MGHCAAGRGKAADSAAFGEDLILALDPQSFLALLCTQCQRCAQDLQMTLKRFFLLSKGKHSY